MKVVLVVTPPPFKSVASPNNLASPTVTFSNTSILSVFLNTLEIPLRYLIVKSLEILC